MNKPVRFLKDAIRISISGKIQDLPQESSQAIFELIAGNNKSEAVNLICRLTGADIKAATEAIDGLEDASKEER